MNKDTGGPAFPEVDTGFDHDAHRYNGHVHSVGGMTLRDYFAAKALVPLIADELIQGAWKHICPQSCKDIAGKAYGIADAMIAERNK